MATAVRPQNPSAPLIPPRTEEEQLASVGRRNFGKIHSVMAMPNLIKVQVDSFAWFKTRVYRNCSKRSRLSLTLRARTWSCGFSITTSASRATRCSSAASAT